MTFLLGSGGFILCPGNHVSSGRGHVAVVSRAEGLDNVTELSECSGGTYRNKT